jgi:hypothetical protein
MCDLDSTLCDTRHRWDLSPIDPLTGEWRVEQESQRAERMWQQYSLNCYLDTEIKAVGNLLRRLLRGRMHVVFVSGRDEAAYGPTLDWLLERGLGGFACLHLKPKGAIWTDHKISVVKEYQKVGISVDLFIEDWPPAVAALRTYGVPVLQVSPPYGEKDLLWPRWAM